MMNKFSKSINKGDKSFTIHFKPQEMANGLFSARLVISENHLSHMNEILVPLKGNLDFNTEDEAAQAALAVGLEWINDLG